jgi:hypothetical protein
MRFIDLDGKGGNQDRSLSADAVIFPATLTIIKNAEPDDPTDFGYTTTGPELSGFSLDDDADGTLSNTKVFSLTSFGAANTRTVAEADPSPAFLLTGLVCTEDSGGLGQNDNSTTDLVSRTATIIAEEGEIITCTFTNTRQPAHLKLVKTVTNNNGGTAAITDFTLSANGPTPISGAGGAESNVDPGTYALSEAGPAGYTAGSWSCVGGTQNGSNVSLGAGQSAICTINNDDQGAHLKLVKTVTNDNGGTAVATDFTLSAAGPTPISGAGGAESDVSAGTYNLSETTLAGYTAGAWSCVGGSQNGASVTLALGESSTCTINNNDNTAHLKLVKTVTNDNGGTAVATDWTLTANGTGTNDISGAGGFDQDVNADTYALSESTGPAGYTAGSFDCGAGPVTSVTLALGESKTCTINNNDNTAHLKLVKVVVNDNGGTAAAGDFTLSASGPTPISGAGAAESDVNAGTYSLTESGPSGYSTSGYDCSTSVTLALGESKTCTITNNDIAPKLHLRKVVVNNNGGLATVADFTLTADGAGSNDLSGTSPVDSGATLQADTWALSETSPAGYSASAWVCVGGQQSGSNITVGIGGEATCTITNDDQAAFITVVKVVNNYHGGTAQSDDFNLTLDGNAVSSGVAVPVNPGTYTAGETLLAGYTFDGFSGDCDSNGDVTVALGQSKTCTLTNSDIAPKLHLRKVVVNDNGGTATVANFTLTANGTGSNDLAGTSPVDSGAGLKADTWALSETSPAGYSASAWVCVGGQQNGGSITLGLAEEATCTITNDDIAPILHLRKVVINDNGGTATVANFTLTANGTGSNDLSGTSPVDSGAGLKADTWTLSETSPAGYSASDWSCVGGTQNGSSITLGLAEEATCTITNDDIAPKLHLRKVVVNDNGGTALATDWTLSADGTGTNDLSGSTPVDSGASLQADTFALAESGPSGYSASAWSCVGGTQNGSNITVGIGGEATCTITNDDIAPQLHLRKIVVNNNGGTATVANFTLSADGTGSNDLSGTSPVDSGAGLQADTWTLSETSLAGYSASAWSCVGGTQNGSNITVGIGGSATCTITNDDIAPKLYLRKVVVNDNGGTATTANFTLTADGTATNDLSGTSPVDSGTGLQADTWALSETSPAGYSASAWSCVGGTQNGSNITVGIGGEATCTITNDDIAPKLHLRKVVTNDNGGTKTVADFTLTANGTGSNDLSGTSPVDSGAGLQADTWALSETNVYGYSASAWVCVGGTQSASNITVGIGGEATCTITNDDQPGTIVIIKNAKPQSGTFSFTTTGSTSGPGTSWPSSFTLNGNPAGGGNTKSYTVDAGTYTVKESTQLSWILTGIGGSTDPNTPYACIVTGSGGSSGTGNLATQTASISLKNGDTVTCVFENTGNGATRTQGFWATHPQLAAIAWNGGSAFGHTFPGVAAILGDTTLCGRTLTINVSVGAPANNSSLMGGFWSSVSTKIPSGKRTALDQARMQLLQQLLAAELNASAFGSLPSGGVATINAWEAAYCGTNQTTIKNALQQAASFNTNGDSATFTPGTSADSKFARYIANLVFWNTLP